MSLLAGCSNTGPPSGTGTSVPATAPASTMTTSTLARRAGETEGAYIFRSQCAGCHGPKGEGNLGPSLTGLSTRMSDAEVVALVQAGKGRMPSFATGLTDAQIRAVVDYTRTELR
jgi:mono/diheme cytochrome c family protein